MFDNILKLAEVPGVPREIFCNKILKKNILWKTMPGRVKQVPQDSTERDRMDTGHSTDKSSTRVISILTLVLNPLVISYKKYIYWKLLMRFIRV